MGEKEDKYNNVKSFRILYISARGTSWEENCLYAPLKKYCGWKSVYKGIEQLSIYYRQDNGILSVVVSSRYWT